MSAASQITILIPDPDEMMFVTGTNEANIDRIEREFDVKIVSRGAELRISGEPAAVARVGDLVGAMRTLSGRDYNLRKPALDRLIDEAKDAPVAPPEQMRDVIATTVRGKRISPQSPNAIDSLAFLPFISPTVSRIRFKSPHSVSASPSLRQPAASRRLRRAMRAQAAWPRPGGPRPSDGRTCRP